jgi:hypothetical protein
MFELPPIVRTWLFDPMAGKVVTVLIGIIVIHILVRLRISGSKGFRSEFPKVTAPAGYFTTANGTSKNKQTSLEAP